ncbi:MAG: secretin and TonB N-terminal domain-containing protein [Rikenellaceae bacterium]|nr:secretin and TonB N-terminal domain-containing protein [Rikenellaceae bacterium]
MNKTCTRVLFRFLFISCLLGLHLNLSAQDNSRITITGSSVTIKDALREVEKQTDYSVNYNETKLDDSKQLDLSVVDQSLDETMKAILGGTGFGYQVRNGYIIIVPERQESPQEPNVVTGRITDEEGLPLVGVAVTIPGTSTGTSTNQTGTFSITAPPGQYPEHLLSRLSEPDDHHH